LFGIVFETVKSPHSQSSFLTLCYLADEMANPHSHVRTSCQPPWSPSAGLHRIAHVRDFAASSSANIFSDFLSGANWRLPSFRLFAQAIEKFSRFLSLGCRTSPSTASPPVLLQMCFVREVPFCPRLCIDQSVLPASRDRRSRVNPAFDPSHARGPSPRQKSSAHLFPVGLCKSFLDVHSSLLSPFSCCVTFFY